MQRTVATLLTLLADRIIAVKLVRWGPSDSDLCCKSGLNGTASAQAAYKPRLCLQAAPSQ